MKKLIKLIKPKHSSSLKRSNVRPPQETHALHLRCISHLISSDSPEPSTQDWQGYNELLNDKKHLAPCIEELKKFDKSDAEEYQRRLGLIKQNLPNRATALIKALDQDPVISAQSYGQNFPAWPIISTYLESTEYPMPSPKDWQDLNELLKEPEQLVSFIKEIKTFLQEPNDAEYERRQGLINQNLPDHATALIEALPQPTTLSSDSDPSSAPNSPRPQ